MKVVFLARDCAQSTFLAERLHAAGQLDTLILESGKVASKNKFKRIFRRVPVWCWPGEIVNLAFLWWMGRKISKHFVVYLLLLFHR